MITKAEIGEARIACDRAPSVAPPPLEAAERTAETSGMSARKKRHVDWLQSKAEQRQQKKQEAEERAGALEQYR